MKKILISGVCLIILNIGLLVYYFCNYDDELIEVDKIETDQNYEDITYDKKENIFQKDVLGVLIIEKIGLNATVKEGSNSEILKEYIGHIEETSIYDGNIGLART